MIMMVHCQKSVPLNISAGSVQKLGVFGLIMADELLPGLVKYCELTVVDWQNFKIVFLKSLPTDK